MVNPITETVDGIAVARAHPSLALIKYWGKVDVRKNLPATPSLAVTLEDLRTETRVRLVESGEKSADIVIVDRQVQPTKRYGDFFDGIRGLLSARGVPRAGDVHFDAESASNFPSAAGLASSASGFAALTIAAVAAAGLDITNNLLDDLSARARVGSGSAARSLYGGFTKLDAGAESAQILRPPDWWPDLRVLVVRVTADSKEVSSREAMERSRRTSPYYDSWVRDAVKVTAGAEKAIGDRDLDALGKWMRLSYQRMFGTMHSADPPIIYWRPESVAAIHLCESLRREGIPAWETMDAGPQVKVLCLKDNLPVIEERFAEVLPAAEITSSRIGGSPRLIHASSLLDGDGSGGRNR